MAFTQGFDNDVFISYSHLDNLSFRWVTQFIEALETVLYSKLGDSVSIWWDKELKPNSLFNQKIKRNLDNSAMFLALLSNNYLKSDYCNKELDWFHDDKRGLGLRIGEESRVIHVLLNNIPYKKWPAQFEGTAGIVMHNASKGSKKDGDYFDHDSQEFRDGVKEIANAVSATLKAFPGTGTLQDSFQPDQDDDEENLYIDLFFADTPEDLRDTRDRLVTKLQSPTNRFLDHIPPPDKHIAHTKAVNKAVTKANLAIHLLDEEPGRRILDYNASTYPLRQLEIGLENDISQLIWIPKNLKYENIKDPEYRELLKHLEFGERGDRKFTFTRALEPNLEKLVKQKIEEVRRLSRAQNPVAQPLQVLLSASDKDLTPALELAKYFDNKGIQYRFNPEYTDIEASLKKFDDYLERARSLVIVYGAGSPKWVRGKLMKTVKWRYNQFDSQSGTSLEYLWLYRMPSSLITQEIKQLTRHFNIQLLDNSHSTEVDEEVLEPLLKSCLDGEVA